MVGSAPLVVPTASRTKLLLPDADNYITAQLVHELLRLVRTDPGCPYSQVIVTVRTYSSPTAQRFVRDGAHVLHVRPDTSATIVKALTHSKNHELMDTVGGIVMMPWCEDDMGMVTRHWLRAFRQVFLGAAAPASATLTTNLSRSVLAHSASFASSAGTALPFGLVCVSWTDAEPTAGLSVNADEEEEGVATTPRFSATLETASTCSGVSSVSSAHRSDCSVASVPSSVVSIDDSKDHDKHRPPPKSILSLYLEAERSVQAEFPNAATVARIAFPQQLLLLWSQMVQEKGFLGLPLSRNKFCPVHLRDVALACTTLLQMPPLLSNTIKRSFSGRASIFAAFSTPRVFRITGPRALSGKDLARTADDHLGDGYSLTYKNLSFEHVNDYLHRLSSAGDHALPSLYVDLLLDLLGQVYDGHAGEASDDFRFLEGQPPMDIGEFFSEWADHFRRDDDYDKLTADDTCSDAATGSDAEYEFV
ncbi:hypothetical protein RI367_005273 [Sorochytrium milnesiophthora]